MAAKLFFSYSHKDEALRDELEVHLSMLKRQGLIEAWHDRRIVAGDPLDNKIGAELNTADIMLFLVSPDFLASDYCYDVEVQRAMQRHAAGEARVIPVILRPCDWHVAPFGTLLAVPKDGLAVTKWPNRDDAFLEVVQAIRKAVGQTGGAAPKAEVAEPSAASTVSEPEIRSSNLRVAKRFTESDRDRFLHQAFEFIAKYFENSLSQLEQRNNDIETTFRRIDANRFTATVYRDGQKASGCTIFLGMGWMDADSISVSLNDQGRTGSYNENLAVEVNDQRMFLKPLGMASQHRTGSGESELSEEGGAELFWSMLIEPLQLS